MEEEEELMEGAKVMVHPEEVMEKREEKAKEVNWDLEEDREG